MKTVIGLIGENGSGKETFANLLEGFVADKEIKRIRTGDILRDILDILYLPKTRANLQILATVLRDKVAPDVIANASFQRIQESAAEIIILDGLRWPPEVDILKKMPGSCLIYITADPKVRFQRLKSRNEKTNEGKMSYQQFLKEENAPTEKLIKNLGKSADVKIKNNGRLEDLRSQVEDFARQKLGV